MCNCLSCCPIFFSLILVSQQPTSVFPLTVWPQWRVCFMAMRLTAAIIASDCQNSTSRLKDITTPFLYALGCYSLLVNPAWWTTMSLTVTISFTVITVLRSLVPLASWGCLQGFVSTLLLHAQPNCFHCLSFGHLLTTCLQQACSKRIEWPSHFFILKKAVFLLKQLL